MSPFSGHVHAVVPLTISYAVHQCARFATFPKQSHADAVRCIVRYLIGTKDEGVIFLDPSNASFYCFVDADFCGTWNPETAEGDASTSKSRTGFVIKYAGCPIVWQSKLQTETALSTTEAEYIALSSTSLREVISLMDLLKEAKAHGIPNVIREPKIHCKVFEDNSGALAMAQMPKMWPRKKRKKCKTNYTGLPVVCTFPRTNWVPDHGTALIFSRRWIYGSVFVCRVWRSSGKECCHALLNGDTSDV